MKNTKKIIGLVVASFLIIVILALAIALGLTGKTNVSANLKIGSLKGPTSMGLLFLMEESENGNTGNFYEFTMATGADELLPLMVKGELDIALVPANVASVLYNKTEGGISVIDINTLSVLYMVSNSKEIGSVSDLAGKTIYLTGQGTTPDFVLQYTLAENGLADSCTLEYKSEATEVVSALVNATDTVIGLLPQPFVTAAVIQNDELNIVLDMNEEWEKVNSDSKMVTGVTVVRNEVLENNKDAVKLFLEEHKKSVDAINADPDLGAAYAVKREIVAAEKIAAKAIPNCNIVCITGEEMKQAVCGYLEVIYDKSKEFLGGKLPENEFYFVP